MTDAPLAPSRTAGGGDETQLGPADLLLAGLWFGLVAGLLEVIGGLAASKWAGVITYDTLRTNRHHAWLTPASYLAIATVAALLLIAASAVLRRRLGRAAIWLYSAGIGWSLALSAPGVHGLARLALAGGLASMGARAVLAWPERFRRLARVTTPIGLAIVALIAAASTGNHRAATAPPRPDAPNVVLIVLDTVRADSLTPYGSARDVTPNLAKLAREGVLFRNAHSTASWTLPAHASLFTGRWPSELSADVGRPLDGTFPTLAEEMAGRGYATAGFVANTENCNAWYGLARGFEHYGDFYENDRITPLEVLRGSRLGRSLATSRWGSKLIEAAVGRGRYQYRKSAEMLGRDALAWLDGRGDRPFFLFLNYFDAHDPYVPPAGAERRYSTPGAMGPQAARDGYDDCLAYLDDQLGRFLGELERQGERERTIFVVTADHGEGFGEHGLSGHGLSLYRMETQIPMIVVAPGKAPRDATVARPVSLRDVAPTILDLVGGGPAAAGPFPGESLASAWAEGASDEPTPVLTELDRAEAVPDEAGEAPARLGMMRSLVTDRHAYIVNGDGREELYDLVADPEESRDLADAPEAVAHLERFRDLMRPHGEPGE